MLDRLVGEEGRGRRVGQMGRGRLVFSEVVAAKDANFWVCSCVSHTSAEKCSMTHFGPLFSRTRFADTLRVPLKHAVGTLKVSYQ